MRLHGQSRIDLKFWASNRFEFLHRILLEAIDYQHSVYMGFTLHRREFRIELKSHSPEENRAEIVLGP